MRPIRPFLTALALGSLTATAPAQCPVTEDQELIAPDAAALDALGTAVALDGDVAVFTAPWDSDGAPTAGSAYVYRRSGSQWVFEQELHATGARSGDQMGQAAAVLGNLIVVGAWRADPAGATTGAAYVFRFDGTQWQEEQELIASDGAAYDFFGSSVATTGNTIFVGAQGHDAPTNSGAVYVFEDSGGTWVETQKLLASNRTGGEAFGIALTCNGTDLVVGAIGDDDRGSYSGACHVFRHDGAQWVEQQKFIGSDTAGFDHFGEVLSMGSDFIAVGSPYHDSAGTNAGAAYVFRYDGTVWVEDAKLTASDAADWDNLGLRIASSNDAIVVGAPSASGTGAAYVLRDNGSGWVEVQKLVASDTAADDDFGLALALQDDEVLVGAPASDNAAATDTGSVYAYRITEVALGVNQQVAPAGSTLTMTTCGGTSGSLAGLFAVDVNGSPMFLALGFGTFDARGQWAMGGTVPAGLSGLTVQFQALGFYVPGKAGLSNRQSVVFP